MLIITVTVNQSIIASRLLGNVYVLINYCYAMYFSFFFFFINYFFTISTYTFYLHQIRLSDAFRIQPSICDGALLQK